MDMLNSLPVVGADTSSYAMLPISPENNGHSSPIFTEKEKHRVLASRSRKKKVTKAVIEQLGEAIGQVAFKDSKFNRAGEIGRISHIRLVTWIIVSSWGRWLALC